MSIALKQPKAGPGSSGTPVLVYLNFIFSYDYSLILKFCGIEVDVYVGRKYLKYIRLLF